jgi:hypothetical protein
MRHPFRRIRNTITYVSVALMGTDTERAYYRRQVNRSHALVRSAAGPVSRFPFNACLQDLRLQMMRNRLMQLRPLSPVRVRRDDGVT